MPKKITIKIRDRILNAELNDSKTALLFYEMLPLTVSMDRWGDEYYGNCGLKMKTDRDAKTEMEVGELAFWPDGSALCIFFGPTPASIADEPRAVSPVNPIGKITGDVSFLKHFPHTIDAEVLK